MKISIKNKFSMIIIFMSILSLIFAYIISDEFISRNLKDKENIREKEKIIHVEREIKSIETGIVSDMEIYSKSKVVQEFYENINQNISIEDKRRLGNNVEEYLKANFVKNYNFLEQLNFSFANKNGIFINRPNSTLERSLDIKTIKNNSYNYFFTDNDLNYVGIVPVYIDGINAGFIILEFIVGTDILTKLSQEYEIDFILFNNNKIIKNTLIGNSDKKFIKGDILEYNNKFYQLFKLSINKNVKDFYITFDKEEYMKERAELSSYLFIALFFVFTLLFIFASTILNIFIDSLRRLTLKINSLKDGNFNVNLGNLKNSNDEIGLLAHDFEMMVHILKGKIKELEEANYNNKHYSERLERVNEELKDSQKKINEKSENIDRINKLLNSRITEISNIYYLMMNISKYMIDDKLYDIIIKGVREGLIINKVALYIRHGDKLLLRRNQGFDKVAESISMNGIDKTLFKKEVLSGEEILNEMDFDNIEETYAFPLTSSREEMNMYGIILISNGEKIKQEFKKSSLTYIKVIVMALENRKLYLKLMEENKKLEETTKELQESEKMKNVFISNISHELRVPLVPIKGYHEIILEEHMGPLNFKQKKALKTSLRNIERLQEIIENILNYSRIESGKYQMLDTEVKVEEIMDESLSRLENLFEGKKVEIKKHYTENGAIVLIDKEALKQICVNLISNAIKFSKENKVSICLGIEDEKNRYKISIKDSGVGIDRSKIDLMLKSFRQFEEGDTRKYNGIGLGLTVAEKILDYYGEKIFINSNLNKGTEVYFYLKKR